MSGMQYLVSCIKCKEYNYRNAVIIIVYYARSANKAGESETVSHHLTRVAQIAEDCASQFDSGIYGHIAGSFHDFGKYSEAFQNVLLGKQQGVNHAIPGAVVLAMYSKLSDDFDPAIIAVEAHHSELSNGDHSFVKRMYQRYLVEDESYDEHGKTIAIQGRDAYKASLNIFHSENAIKSNRPNKQSYNYCTNPKIALMLFIRMIFSSLVDGDYSDSASHFDEKYAEKSQGIPLDTELLLINLFNYRDEIKRVSSAATTINNLREQVFNDCILAAKKPSGLFTLTAPTGLGKTLALMAFALTHAKEHHHRRIIIVLPFVSIIEQNAKIYRDIAGQEVVLEDHSLVKHTEETRFFSERWSAPIIVTTSVKFFEALFANKPTDCRRLHNITNSIIVFDEAQSLPNELISATLDAVNALCRRYKCTIIFSTATQPSFSYRPEVDWKPCEIIRDSSSLYLQTRRVQVRWRTKTPTNLSTIAAEIAQIDSACVIVNLKRHARRLFDELDKCCSNKDSLFYISTNMCPAHRSETLDTIKERLKNKQPCRLVSTQCIEAGVDVDFTVLYRALAPLDSIIQAAGRCNRNGVFDEGMLHVFIPDEPGPLYPSDYYENAANKVLLMLSRGEIDLQNIQHIEEYYRLLFQDSIDKRELTEAINCNNFKDVTAQYKLIGKQGVQIIVPYHDAVFKEIQTEASTGLTNAIMAKAQSITVGAFKSEKLLELCELIPYYLHGKPVGSSWYLLCSSKAYDKKKLGLILEESELKTAL